MIRTSRRFLLPRRHRHVRRRVRGPCEPILWSISESSVITAEALRFLTQALMDGARGPSRVTFQRVDGLRSDAPEGANEPSIIAPAGRSAVLPGPGTASRGARRVRDDL